MFHVKQCGEKMGWFEKFVNKIILYYAMDKSQNNFVRVPA